MPHTSLEQVVEKAEDIRKCGSLIISDRVISASVTIALVCPHFLGRPTARLPL